jgi:dynein heavy chain
MVTLSGSCIWWAWQTEDAFRQVAAGDKHALKKHAQKLSVQMGELIAMVGCRQAHC